ncbi:MAG TPA: PhzF family phenazine biosynthesis protein [Ignavibacteriaceae bacterium]|nr:PhzF family phenazine biosynthesis protein [Ignavibacteriaceae bacterium]
MTKKINIFQIDAFTDQPFGGNPAGVTFSDGLNDNEMRLIAKEMNLAETAFLGKSEKADYHLRWFTPAVEVELCGHATIASLHFLNENNLLKEGKEITFDTLSGILKCKFENGKYHMQIPVYSMEEFTGCKEEILDCLGIYRNDIDDNIPFILAGNGYLYINIKSLQALHKLNPDIKVLKKLNEEKKEFGCATVYTIETIDEESFAHSRFFAPFYGIDEDPVTGSMNGPLIQVLIKAGFLKDDEEKLECTFEQGDVLGRKGRVTVSYKSSSKDLYIAGKAVTMIKGEIYI